MVKANQKYSIAAFILILIYSFAVTGTPYRLGDGGADSDTLRLFLIGNSFSQNATRYLPQLAAEGGHPLKIGRAELGGCSLQRHWEIAEAAEKNPDDPKGKAYGGKSLRELLSAGTWDVITIQQNSMNSGDVTTYMPYARKLYDLVKSIQPNARVVMQQTWAYRTDAKKFTQTANNQFATNAQEMWKKSRAAYHSIAKELGIRLLPVGDAFWKINSAPQWAYQPDTRFNFEDPKYPVLPTQLYSLHVGYRYDNSQKLAFDGNHANEAGCFLGGLVWYAVLFQESPVKLKFKPENVEDDFAKQLRKVAREVTKGM
ncbi:hypothetical protein DYBT9275_00077 [Dyadobacter sp. CECT 9275]|uniref:DUF4886 domain-containing protein n=1 Tax=Dyadobacter helix TaxID=2822344 RepID=A0A916N3W2_9BACT|nr:DUF4886 domain-containing protein [Dyadobacter sp. CECT 9275]CAG4988416.1 hypothetical protein DYBT9275_00077 [Dyadobacter sp. CECT 9275]